RRESFERRITRPHFHVKPLDDAQLSAWSQYLDFEQAQAASSAPRVEVGAARKEARGEAEQAGEEQGEVRRLFERCLVSCASYWWLWERYALWKVR
ncbi:unnamed protein product, partial [Laminaria digitata]